MARGGRYRQPRIVSLSDLPLERLHQRSLVMENSRAGIRELTFVLPVVVGAKEQVPVPAFRDMNAEQNVGLGAAPITAINSIENHHCRVMPPWGAKAPGASFIDYGGRSSEKPWTTGDGSVDALRS